METTFITPTALRIITLLLIVILIDYMAVIVATLIDLRSGTLRARRQGISLTSRGFRRTVDKMLRYLISLIALSVIDGVVVTAAMLLRATQHWSVPVFPIFTTLGAIALTLIEAKSVLENTRTRHQYKDAAHSLSQLLADDDITRIAQRIRSLNKDN